MNSKYPHKAANVDFKHKLFDLRDIRAAQVNKVGAEAVLVNGIVNELFTAIQECMETLIDDSPENLHFTVYFKRSKPGRLFPKGPYLQVKYRKLAEKKWTTYHLGVVTEFSSETIKAKLPNVIQIDIPKNSIDNLYGLVSLLNQLLSLKDDLERIRDTLNVSIVANKENNNFKALNKNINMLFKLMPQRMLIYHATLSQIEILIDKEVMKFNSIMKKRYRSLFMKWNIHPPKKKRCNGPQSIRPYIITSTSIRNQYSESVLDFKRKRSTGNKSMSPWITNRICIEARASQLRKKILDKQRDIVLLSDLWETNYASLADINTYFSNLLKGV